jgi:hypothetical protein
MPKVYAASLNLPRRCREDVKKFAYKAIARVLYAAMVPIEPQPRGESSTVESHA